MSNSTRRPKTLAPQDTAELRVCPLTPRTVRSRGVSRGPAARAGGDARALANLNPAGQGKGSLQPRAVPAGPGGTLLAEPSSARTLRSTAVLRMFRTSLSMRLLAQICTFTATSRLSLSTPKCTCSGIGIRTGHGGGGSSSAAGGSTPKLAAVRARTWATAWASATKNLRPARIDARIFFRQQRVAPAPNEQLKRQSR